MSSTGRGILLWDVTWGETKEFRGEDSFVTPYARHPLVTRPRSVAADEAAASWLANDSTSQVVFSLFSHWLVDYGMQAMYHAMK